MLAIVHRATRLSFLYNLWQIPYDIMNKPTVPSNPPATINPQALQQNPETIYEAFGSSLIA